MENVEFLYNSNGKWIAFKIGKFLYNSQAQWIGWFPWENEHAVTKTGKYLGSIYSNNRFYKQNYFPHLDYPGYPGYPDYWGHPGYPSYGGYLPKPINTKDFEPEDLNAL